MEIAETILIKNKVGELRLLQEYLWNPLPSGPCPYLQGSRLGPVVRSKVLVLGGLIKAKAPIVVPKAKGLGFLPRNTVRVMCKVISPPGFYFYCAEHKKKGKKF